MTLYTLIRAIATENPEHGEMIKRRIAPEVSYIKIGEGRIAYAYPSIEAAANDAEYWNKRIEDANFVPAKVTFGGEITYRLSRFWREIVEEIKRAPTYEELGYRYSTAFAGLSGGLASKAALEQLLNNIDPNFPPEQKLIFAGVLGLVSFGSYLLGRSYRVATGAIATNLPCS